MRLEIESTVAAPPMTEDVAAAERSELDLAEIRSALNQGIKAAQAGNRGYARISLTRVTELDPRNESAWLWLASISEYPEELLGFLTQVLNINPDNARALEWKAATHALLSRTFVQRGIDACQENRKEFAVDCFQTALQHDENNSTAWMWLASLTDSNYERVVMLEKAVALDSENTEAVAALTEAKNKIVTDRLAEAKAAAISGNKAEATRILDDLLTVKPESIDAWTMKSHLADGFDEKIRCFESILAIDPDNLPAKAGRDSLLSIFGAVDGTEYGAEAAPAVEPDITSAVDKSPTQDLKPVADFDFASMQPSGSSPEPDQTHPENKDANETIEVASEPFAPVAEETPAFPPADGEYVAAYEEPSAETYSDNGHPAAAFADPDVETDVFSYEPESPAQPQADEPKVDKDPMQDDETSTPSGEFVIPMPDAELAAEPGANGYITQILPGEALHVRPESFDCPYCGHTNDAQSISCTSCLAVLTLSDLELLLGNQNSDKMLLRQAVEEMERKRLTQEFSSGELTILGLGHLNLRNFQLGYACLSEASKLSPNNVVLGSQVNSLLIRLEEIKLQEEAHLRMPKGKSILVVDDSPTVRKLIAGKLEKSGHDVICANDGVEAMERLEDYVPDLILLDINMPRMDGYQVCKNIRSNTATKDVPVVMISGKDGFFDKVRGRMAGTTGYITKPFGPETLMKAVEMYLSGEAPALEEV